MTFYASGEATLSTCRRKVKESKEMGIKVLRIEWRELLGCHNQWLGGRCALADGVAIST